MPTDALAEIIRTKDIKGKNPPSHMVPSRICSTNFVTLENTYSFA